ncbi:MAG: M56 family metallopeptidase, partial [Segetibacter sp.]
VLSPEITTPEYNGQHVLLFLFIAGLFVMVVRLIVQYVSYLNIKRKAKLLFTEGIKLYEVEENIVPFSFGTSIFINQKFENKEERNEILHHELVHVRQRHSIDILWAEVLCALNWYNPFAWLLRHHVRQNLEFIADNKVLENGIDKKQYQYLLLKVMGVSGPGITVPFNFSSLKKRIIMMNKLKSARLHLVKFLFVLPLLAVLLIAFRSKVDKTKADRENGVIIISGVVVQGDNYVPLQNVHYKVEGSRIEGNTDERGYYTYSIPVSGYPRKVNTLFSKEGFKPNQANREFRDQNSNPHTVRVEIIGLTATNKETTTGNAFVHSALLTGVSDPESVKEEVFKKFEQVRLGNNEAVALKKLSEGSEKPYWLINGHTYIINSGGGSVSWDTIANTILVDGKK